MISGRKCTQVWVNDDHVSISMCMILRALEFESLVNFTIVRALSERNVITVSVGEWAGEHQHLEVTQTSLLYWRGQRPSE